MIIKFLIIGLWSIGLLSLPTCIPQASAAPLANSSQRYNTQGKQMEQLKDNGWKSVGVPADFQKSLNNCLQAGEQTFNPATQRMEFCDGAKKYSLICGISLNNCDNTDLGRQKYDNTLGIQIYCDGQRWIYLGSVPNVPCCPEGFVPVPKNPAAGTTRDFCVSKYHMKPVHAGTHVPADGMNLGDNNAYYPESRAADKPWGKVTLNFTKNACDKLNKNGIPGDFHLITNAEWITIAHNIENNPENWSGNAVGVGHIPTGHSDGDCASFAPGCQSNQTFLPASSNDQLGCHLTNNNDCLTKNSTDFWQKRTFILNNSDTENTVIWDMAGNINSWVDTTNIPISFDDTGLSTPIVRIYQVNDNFIYGGLNGPIDIYPTIRPFLFPTDPKNATNQLAFLPANDYGINHYDQLGFGTIRLEVNSNGGLFRGGKFDEPRMQHMSPDPDLDGRHFKTGEWERRGGLYSAWIFNENTQSSTIGFRCTYIPEN